MSSFRRSIADLARNEPDEYAVEFQPLRPYSPSAEEQRLAAVHWARQGCGHDFDGLRAVHEKIVAQSEACAVLRDNASGKAGKHFWHGKVRAYREIAGWLEKELTKLEEFV